MRRTFILIATAATLAISGGSAPAQEQEQTPAPRVHRHVRDTTPPHRSAYSRDLRRVARERGLNGHRERVRPY